MARTVILQTCPVCDGASLSRLPTPGRWIGADVFNSAKEELALVRCDGCGLHFINPRPGPELLDAFYSGDNYGCHDAVANASAGAKDDFLLAKLAAALPGGLAKTLLDYGCGGGAFLRHAQTSGWQVRGFEPGRRGREVCRGTGLDVVEKMEELPDAQFSIVTLQHVFEHLTDHRAILKGIQRVLVPGGVVFIEVPNVQSLRARLSAPFLSRHYNFDERHRAFPIHLCYFDPRTIKRLLERCGWMVTGQFTAGMGIDELRMREEKKTPGSGAAAPGRPRRSRGLRSMVKKLVLDWGLGENLCVFATAGTALPH